MGFSPSNLPVENEYPKLVRDKIPDIILVRTGKAVEQQILADDRDFLKALLKKLREEAAEAEYSLVNNNLEEELADILEIIETIMKLRKINLSDILVVQNSKREKNGGFEKRILMLGKVD